MGARSAAAAAAGAAIVGLPVVAAGVGSSADEAPPVTPPDPRRATPNQVARLQDELVAAQRRARYWRRRAYRLRLHRNRLRREWAPTVDYSLRLASAVSGVSYWALRSVAHCESTLDPGAANGRYRGLFQLSWAPFGFSPFDPVANAISAGLTVRHDGGWRQWECKP